MFIYDKRNSLCINFKNVLSVSVEGNKICFCFLEGVYKELTFANERVATETLDDIMTTFKEYKNYTII